MESSHSSKQMQRLKVLATRDDSYTWSLRNWVSGYDIVDKVSKYGVIAGGAVTYSLNEFIEKPSQDIDVFILNGDLESFRAVVKLLSDYYTIKDYRIYNSLLELETSTGLVWQLIFSGYKTVSELLSNFDMDYVRCGYHKGIVTVTPEAQRAFDTKTIAVVAARIKSYRLKKAEAKGFACSQHLKAMASPVSPAEKQFTHTSLDEVLERSFSRLTIQEYEEIDLAQSKLSLSWKPWAKNAWGDMNVSRAMTSVRSLDGKQKSSINDTLCHVLPVSKCDVPPQKPETSRWLCEIKADDITDALLSMKSQAKVNINEESGKLYIYLSLPDEAAKMEWQWMKVYWNHTRLIAGTVHPILTSAIIKPHFYALA